MTSFKFKINRLKTCLTGMVVTKGEACEDVGIQETGLGKKTRPITKRVSELPSLRYGSIGAKTSSTGPLRLTSCHYYDNKCKTKTNGYDNSQCKSRHSPRRVRFTLPSADGVGNTKVVVGAGGVANTKSSTSTMTTGGGDVGWLRTRASLSHRSNVHHSKAHTSNYNNTTSTIDNFRIYEIRLPRPGVSVPITASPGVRRRIHPTGRYVRGTLSPTASAAPHAAASPEGLALLKAARDGDDQLLSDLLRRAAIVGITEIDLNAVDISGRTVLSYIASNGSIELLEQILQLPGLNPNKPDNEGNTPLHFAAQAGQVECLSCMLSRCRGIEIDARNNLGFTPLMKAALQGRNKCAKLLLFAGANPTLRDNGRGFRADQWARFCGRYICADVIEKHARQRLLERSTSYGNWGVENEIGTRVLMGKVVPVPPVPQQTSNGIKSKLRKVFRSSSNVGHNHTYSSARLVTQLTSAALCASSPVLPSAPTIPPVVKSLIRPLTVPRLQITLANNNNNNNNSNNNNIDHPNNNLINGIQKTPIVKPAIDNKINGSVAIKPDRTKKKK